jgi:transcriptional regulator with XRE-family HTH domain
MATFGEYIKAKRESLNWTQPIAAQKAEIEQSYLSKLENGKCYPSEQMFNRLLELYELNISDLSEALDTDELKKMKDIAQIRMTMMEAKLGRKAQIQKWLMAGLVMLIFAGALIGAAIVPQQSKTEYRYSSHGVLKPGESLRTYSAAYVGNAPEELVNRIDQKYQVFDYNRGKNFVETTTEGRRLFQLYSTNDKEENPMAKWLIVPGLALLFGSFGCFLVGFRYPK